MELCSCGGVELWSYGVVYWWSCGCAELYMYEVVEVWSCIVVYLLSG